MKKKETCVSVLSGLLWKLGERISAQLITLIVSIILARILEPNDFGVVALVMIFITVANVFVSDGLGSALVQKKGADNVDFSSVFYFNLAFSILIYFVIFVTAPFVAEFFGNNTLTELLRVLGIRIIIAAINSVQQAYVARHMLFKKFFWSTLIGTLLSGVLGVLMAYQGFGVWALVTQYIANTLTDTVVLWITVKWRPDFVFSWKKTKKLLDFGWKILASALLNVFYNQMTSIFIGKYYSSEDLAYYSQAERYPLFFVTNVNASISGVIFPAMSKIQTNIEEVRKFTRKTIQLSSYLIWPLMVGLAVVADPLVKVILTEKWTSCVPYIQIFCISYGFWPLHSANLQALNALGRSDLFLKLEIIKKLVGLIALTIAVKQGPFAIALSILVTSVISSFINAYPNMKILQYGITSQMHDIASSLCLSIVMGGVIWGLRFWISDPLTLLCVQVICGFLIYVFFSKKMKLEEYEDIKDIIGSLLNFKNKYEDTWNGK